MGRSILRRTAYTIPVVVLISILAFSLMHLAPGGPVGMYTGNPRVSGEDVQRIRESYGLDRPLPVQYLYWFRQVFLKWDLGKSYVTGQDVSEMIIERVPATVELMATAFLIALLASVGAGMISATRPGSLADQAVSLLSIAGTSVPVFWTGIMAIYLFSVRLGVLPAGGRYAYGAEGTFNDHIARLVLPAIVLSISYFGSWVRYIRGGLAEALSGDFILAARAKGLSRSKVLFKHALKNAVIPALTVMVMQIPTMFSGAVITETVFSWPGMGRLFYEGLQRQDYTRVMGVIVISSVMIVIFNLAGDILNMLIDPRIDSEIGHRKAGPDRPLRGPAVSAEEGVSP